MWTYTCRISQWFSKSNFSKLCCFVTKGSKCIKIKSKSISYYLICLLLLSFSVTWPFNSCQSPHPKQTRKPYNLSNKIKCDVYGKRHEASLWTRARAMRRERKQRPVLGVQGSWGSDGAGNRGVYWRWPLETSRRCRSLGGEPSYIWCSSFKCSVTSVLAT